jgi:hypothetical protein
MPAARYPIKKKATPRCFQELMGHPAGVGQAHYSRIELAMGQEIAVAIARQEDVFHLNISRSVAVHGEFHNS